MSLDKFDQTASVCERVNKMRYLPARIEQRVDTIKRRAMALYHTPTSRKRRRKRAAALHHELNFLLKLAHRKRVLVLRQANLIKGASFDPSQPQSGRWKWHVTTRIALAELAVFDDGQTFTVIKACGPHVGVQYSRQEFDRMVAECAPRLKPGESFNLDEVEELC